MSTVASLVAESRRDESPRSSQTGEHSFLANAVRRARPSSCPNCRGFDLVSLHSGSAVEMRCKSWSCSVCSQHRRAVAIELFSEGINRASRRGERIRFLTLTSPPEGMTLADLYAAWNRLRTTLRKSGELREFCAVVELGAPKRPEPHLHLVATGSFIPQARLSGLAERAGFGPIADIRLVDGAGQERTVHYLSKQLVGYLAKSKAKRLGDRVASEGRANRKQVRPVRCSRNWYPGGFAAAEQAIADRARAEIGETEGKDPGPWLVVVRRTDGGVTVVARPKRAEHDDDGADQGASDSGATRAAAEESAQVGAGRER